MTFRGPSCNKYIFPLFAAFGGKSRCPHCGEVLTATMVSKGFIFAALAGIGIGKLLEDFLKQWLSEEVAFVFVCAALVVLGVAISQPHSAKSSSAQEKADAR
jgi:cyanate permease